MGACECGFRGTPYICMDCGQEYCKKCEEVYERRCECICGNIITKEEYKKLKKKRNEWYKKKERLLDQIKKSVNGLKKIV